MPERRGHARACQIAPLRVGLISDTHGLLRPAALEFLLGCQHIIHGGDIGNPEILEQLALLAPVTAVRGNNDTGPWAEGLRAVEVVRLACVVILAIHDQQDIDVNLTDEHVNVVVFGHSHKPQVEHRDEALFVNPGSAGPRRFNLPITVGELFIEGERVRARTVNLLTFS